MKKTRATVSAPEGVSAEAKSTRRKFLSAATAGVAALGFPMVSNAQAPIKLRFQAGWPTKDAFYAYSEAFVKKISDMTAGKLIFELLPAGSVVKPFDMLDAVHSGTLDSAARCVRLLVWQEHRVFPVWYRPCHRHGRANVTRLGRARRRQSALRRAGERDHEVQRQGFLKRPNVESAVGLVQKRS